MLTIMKVNSEKKESRELIPGKVLEKWIQASKAELFYEALLDEIICSLQVTAKMF